MLREKSTVKQTEYEVVLLDELVPQDHLLRKIDRVVDFSFIHDLRKDLYCPDNGRPAIEPELLFRMLFLGYLYGIKSETKLAQAVTGKPPPEKDTGNTTATARNARGVRDEKNALEQAQPEGWWKGMYGRMHWMPLQRLRRRTTADGYTAGVNKPLSAPLRKPKKTTASVLLACSASKTCVSSAS